MITVSTLVKFLLFNAEATRQIADSKRATWVGLLLVISAGFAREYDGEYLVAEPWHVLIPVAASLIGCFLMVLFVHVLAWFRLVRDVPFFESFRSFLNLYWMTAPLAWLYAIPFERFLDPAGATQANLSLLGVVAVWRVAVMVRCVQVVYKAHPVAAFFPVILFSDILAMAAIWLVPGPIFMIMGGVRLTESENIILGVRIWLILIGYGTFLIWLIGYVVLCSRPTPWRFFKSEPNYKATKQAISRGVWGLVAISLLVWIPILPSTQNEQWLRWTSERLIRAENFSAFSKVTQQYPEPEFPPHWDPPPRLGYGETKPRVFKVLSGLLANDAAQWMVNRYADKLENEAKVWYLISGVLDTYTDDELAQLVDTISKLPEAHEIAANYHSTVEQWLAEREERELTESKIESLTRLQQLGQTEE